MRIAHDNRIYCYFVVHFQIFATSLWQRLIRRPTSCVCVCVCFEIINKLANKSGTNPSWPRQGLAGSPPASRQFSTGVKLLHATSVVAWLLLHGLESAAGGAAVAAAAAAAVAAADFSLRQCVKPRLSSVRINSRTSFHDSRASELNCQPRSSANTWTADVHKRVAYYDLSRKMWLLLSLLLLLLLL